MNDSLSPAIQSNTGVLTSEQVEAILEEISVYEVVLEEDPTLPTLGMRYLQSVLAKCRTYLNRVQYYLQLTKRQEKQLRMDLKQREMDIEFKLKELLADEPAVRQQPSIEDRKAMAFSMLRKEHEAMASVKVRLIDMEETVRLIKSTYDHLNRTNGDIKLQRNIVRDDRAEQMSGGEGYQQPQANRDRTVPGGLVPAITTKPLEPEELWPENKVPEPMPKAVEGSHSRQVMDFLNAKMTVAPKEKPSPKAVEKPVVYEPAVETLSADDLL